MNDLDGCYYEVGNDPFCPITGRLTRLFKGGAQAPPPTPPPVPALPPTPPPPPVAAKAADTPQIVGQVKKDDDAVQQKKRAKNQSVIGAQNDSVFGSRLKLGS